MKLEINGETKDFNKFNSLTINKVLEINDLLGKSVVTELNGSIEYDFNRELFDGDKLEIIKIVGGG